MNYREALAWLYGTQRFGIKLGLENIQRLLADLSINPRPARTPGSARDSSRACGISGDSPETPTLPHILHVAGTNGKGSVCAMIDAICRAQRYRTGLFTSPHLVTYRERIQVNGEMIAEEEVAAGLAAIRKLISDWRPHPTFFEITTAMALMHFKKRDCEVIALETGLGGRLDATNAIIPVASVITPIGYDHQAWLGTTLEQIAAEKAGIIKPHVPVVSATQDPVAEKVVRERAAECDAQVQFVSESYRRSPLALAGEHQKENASLAIAALRCAAIPVEENAIAEGLANVRWPARFQQWDERTIIDGAHNPDGARVLVKIWREQFGEERATIILAILRDKDVAGIWRALAPIAERLILPHVRSERALEPDDLAKVVRAMSPELSVSIAPSLNAAWNDARKRSARILITGSLHFAGEALAALQGAPAVYEECAQ